MGRLTKAAAAKRDAELKAKTLETTENQNNTNPVPGTEVVTEITGQPGTEQNQNTENSGTNETTRPEFDVVDNDLISAFPWMTEAGIKVGDIKNQEFMVKADEFLQDNPHHFPVDHPNYKPLEYVTQEDIDMFPFIVNAGVKVGDAKTSALGVKVEEFLKEYPWYLPVDDENYKPNPNAHDGSKDEGPTNVPSNGYIYHGDHLTDGQLHCTVTFDWDEVTAPEHLHLKPEK